MRHLALAALVLAACDGELQPLDNALPGDSTVGGEDNTFDHPGAAVDVWELLERARFEGPARYAARIHGCPKMTYDNLGRVLASLGVDLAAADPASAGGLYRAGAQALGAPDRNARQRESRDLSTAGASAMFDVFAAAAPEIIAHGPCGVPMFDAAGRCNLDGITCLLGVPATAAHLELCNLTIDRASDPARGQRIAVATLLAAAHTCE